MRIRSMSRYSNGEKFSNTVEPSELIQFDGGHKNPYKV